MLVDQKEEDLGEIKLRFSDETALVKRIQEHLSLFVVLFAEIESLRKRVKDKEREVEDVRRSSLAPFRSWSGLAFVNSTQHITAKQHHNITTNNTITSLYNIDDIAISKERNRFRPHSWGKQNWNPHHLGLAYSERPSTPHLWSPYSRITHRKTHLPSEEEHSYRSTTQTKDSVLLQNQRRLQRKNKTKGYFYRPLH